MIACKWCGLPGSPQCSECWELETRIKQMPLVAKRMVRDALADGRVARVCDAIGSGLEKAENSKLIFGVLTIACLAVFAASCFGLLK